MEDSEVDPVDVIKVDFLDVTEVDSVDVIDVDSEEVIEVDPADVIPGSSDTVMTLCPGSSAVVVSVVTLVVGSSMLGSETLMAQLWQKK